MKIRYSDGDPRAGRVVNLDERLAKRFIDDGVAVEVDKDTPLSDGNDIATGDGSTGTMARLDMSPNAGPEETTAGSGIRGSGSDVLDDGDDADPRRRAGEAGDGDGTDGDGTDGDGRKSTGPTGNKAVTTSRSSKQAAGKKAGRR